MTEEQREALVQHWLDVELDYAEECRATAGRISEAKWEEEMYGLWLVGDLAHEDLCERRR